MAHHQPLRWNILNEAIHQSAERNAVREIVDATKAIITCNSMLLRKFSQASSDALRSKYSSESRYLALGSRSNSHCIIASRFSVPCTDLSPPGSQPSVQLEADGCAGDRRYGWARRPKARSNASSWRFSSEIDLSLIQPTGEGPPHQHGERRKPVPRRRAGHRTQRPVIGQVSDEGRHRPDPRRASARKHGPARTATSSCNWWPTAGPGRSGRGWRN